MSEKKKTNGKKKPGVAKSKAGGVAGPMNVEFLQELVSLMSANDLNTMDLRDSDRRIVLKRGAQQVFTTVAQGAPSAPAPTVSGTPTAAPPPAATPVNEDAGLLPIKSPMVGTFYAASSPDAKPFVSVGTHVVKDETDVCIIEAMKVFNNIKTEVTGTIAKVLVTSGQTVEFGTVLFLVKPS